MLDVYKMNIKIINILSILLIIGIIPSASIVVAYPTQDEGTLWLRGLIFIYEIEDNTVYAFAIRLHYIQWTESAGSFGTITFIDVTFPDEYHLILIGRLIYIIGISNGNIVF